MKVGDLVKRRHLPFTYGIIVMINRNSESLWVSWVDEVGITGYNTKDAFLSMEVISESR